MVVTVDGIVGLRKGRSIIGYKLFASGLLKIFFLFNFIISELFPMSDMLFLFALE